MRLLTVAIALSLAAVSYADIITLKNGRIINGTYLGGTARQIKVEVGDNIQTVDVGDVARIEFSSGGYTSSRDIPRDTPPDNGRPTLRRADGSSSSGSSSGSDSGYGGYGSGGSGSGSGSSGSRPVILQPDPNDTGSYPSSSSGSSLPADNSRPTLRRASDSSSSSTSSSSSSDDNRPVLQRPSSSSSDSSSSSSSSSDDGRPVLRRAAPDPAATPATPATTPAATVAKPAAAPPPPPPAPPAIKVGQTQDEVVNALGQPESVDASGDKQIYIYKNVKVTFVNGKVSKVE